jgi:beta-galactosidase
MNQPLRFLPRVWDCAALGVLLFTLALATTVAARTVDFNRGWQFTTGDPAGAEALEFDDLAWSTVRLPHDWAISGPFDPDVDGYAAKLPWKGVGWYRKWFMLDAVEEGSRVYLDFDGVMAFPQVYINGELAGEWDYGYTSFRVDATPHVRYGRSNMVAVRVDTHRQGTRWYPGAGIYRDVQLVVRPPVHLAHGGTFVTTPRITDDAATVVVVNAIDNHLAADASAEVEVTIRSPDGQIVGQRRVDALVTNAGPGEARHEFHLSSPLRWDIDHPHLYTATTALRIDGRVVDRRTTTFGVRTFEFTADDGFHLNGRRVQLYGVNLHHDLGPLGAAFNRRAMERQLEIMQDMGVNALRTSHNPTAAEVLDLCDRMGILVWDEVFDKWDDKAGRVDGEPPLAEFAARHVRSLVLRDRNHPSVVVWSIGNEIASQPYDKEGKSRERVEMMRDLFRQDDPTRPVGLGCHISEDAYTDVLADLDVVGWNYAARYELFRERFPKIPIIYSESASALSTRGFYDPVHPTTKVDYSDTHQVDSYDMNAAPWSDLVDVEFALMERDRFVAGEFVWTGFDYLGEPTPFSREARSSYFGIVDLCGIPKDRFYLYRSHWRPDTPTVHILPHWNWAGREGRNVPVFVYTNGDAAELFLNGRSLGMRQKGDIPPRPENLIRSAVATSSTSADEHPAKAALTRGGPGWLANEGDANAWWQVDLGRSQPIRCLELEFQREAHHYACAVEASTDGTIWNAIASHERNRGLRWGGVRQAYLSVDADARYLRITFGRCSRDTKPGLQSLAVYDAPCESDYYEPTYRYRLRWDDVLYEPGELRTVAYKNGVTIGEATVATAGKPASIRLTPDRTEIDSSGDDLSYVLVEAVDADGVVCPLADDLVTFDVNGPANIAAVGNGNPLSLEPFQASHRKLFFGKAMLIVRASEGLGGEIQVTASAAGLEAGETSIRASGR